MMKVRFGIVGPGNIARKMVSAIGESDVAQLYGVASRNLQKAEAFCEKYGGKKAYDSYEKMFADPEIETVYIALPNSLHLPAALQAMSYGKPVICEKPFAPRSDMTRQAVGYAREHGILFVEGSGHGGCLQCKLPVARSP